MVSLAARLKSRCELVLLAVDDIFATLHPLAHSFARFSSLLLDVFLAFLGGVEDGLTGLAARPRSIQDAQQRAKSKPCQKPHEAIAAVSLRHRYNLQNSDGSTHRGLIQIAQQSRIPTAGLSPCSNQRDLRTDTSPGQ